LKLQQVFLNILKNGAQAMSSDRMGERAPCFKLKARTEDRSLLIEICDNGPGIPADVLKNFFEPFFTIHPVDRGSGLELSVAYFIITEIHSGTMAVDSIQGEGACITIGLPLQRS